MNPKSETMPVHTPTLSPAHIQTPLKLTAVTELMAASKRPKPSSPPKPTTHIKKSYDRRDDLIHYIQHPETQPGVVEYDDDFVVIRDLFPKASIHLLILPRDPQRWHQHPLQALSTDPKFLSQVKEKVEKVKKMAADELRRLYGQYLSLIHI